MSISPYTDFYSHFASPDTFICVLLFSFFCYSSDYVITIFAEICENVDSTKKHQTGQPKPYKHFFRPAETDNADFNIRLLFTLAKKF